MPVNCATCGLPEELCVCATISKEGAKITVKAVKKKFNALATVIIGMENKEEELRHIVKQLKAKFACGGTYKDGIVELQGDHRKRMKDILVELGFAPESIDVKTEVE
jgi:translation initiation factor 1